MDKTNIPYGERIDIEETDLTVSELPGEWEWISANRNSMEKVNVYFGRNPNSEGGWLGEIDNFTESGGNEVWELHIREILPASSREKDTRVAEEPETVEKFQTLEEAIHGVEPHIKTKYDY